LKRGEQSIGEKKCERQMGKMGKMGKIGSGERGMGNGE